jgi:hypothetical protein
VYIAAFGLDEGESIEGLSKQGPRQPAQQQFVPLMSTAFYGLIVTPSQMRLLPMWTQPRPALWPRCKSP